MDPSPLFSMFPSLSRPKVEGGLGLSFGADGLRFEVEVNLNRDSDGLVVLDWSITSLLASILALPECRYV